ncbi:hypothetical protein CSA80_04715 [Candidatus Saccharibacteria bacterium]|nr:MAG: hypothetical protein CSA80_04715 [Candidatus Saccharibacteria bacterium]
MGFSDYKQAAGEMTYQMSKPGSNPESFQGLGRRVAVGVLTVAAAFGGYFLGHSIAEASDEEVIAKVSALEGCRDAVVGVGLSKETVPIGSVPEIVLEECAELGLESTNGVGIAKSVRSLRPGVVDPEKPRSLYSLPVELPDAAALQQEIDELNASRKDPAAIGRMAAAFAAGVVSGPSVRRRVAGWVRKKDKK